MKSLLKNLFKLKKNYNANKSDFIIQQLILKFALLEICGWIENKFDEIYLSCAKDSSSRKDIENHIKNIYSFGYQKNIYPTLCYCIGINKVQELENNFTQKDLDEFKGILTTLKNKRDELAHNHLIGASPPTLLGWIDLRNHLKHIYQSINTINKFIATL